MTTADGSPGQSLGQHEFVFDGKTITAEKEHSCWTLRLSGRVIETHDLTRGIDELLGKSVRNRGLVLLILEWQAGLRAQ
jgi:hypothetical protein